MSRMNTSEIVLVLSAVCAAMAAAAGPGQRTRVPIFDMIPGLSQFKSVAQLFAGDEKGAAETQANYLNDGLGPSQIRSGYYLATGDPAKAAQIQRRFLNSAKCAADRPGGAAGPLNGPAVPGWRAIKAAASDVAAFTGGVAIGPVGVAGGHAVADALMSGVEMAVAREAGGIADCLAEIGRNGTAGGLDTIAGLFAGAGGARATPANARGTTPKPGPLTAYRRTAGTRPISAGTRPVSAERANPPSGVLGESVERVAGSLAEHVGRWLTGNRYSSGVRKPSAPVDVPYPYARDNGPAPSRRP